MSAKFHEWIEGLVESEYGTNTVIADALDMTLSGFRKGAKKGTLSTENLLKLAKLVGSPDASEVLARAGKPDVAKIIEYLYGPPRETLPAVTALTELLAAQPHLDEAAQGMIDVLRLAGTAAPKSGAVDTGRAAPSSVTKGTRARRSAPKKKKNDKHPGADGAT